MHIKFFIPKLTIPKVLNAKFLPFEILHLCALLKKKAIAAKNADESFLPFISGGPKQALLKVRNKGLM